MLTTLLILIIFIETTLGILYIRRLQSVNDQLKYKLVNIAEIADSDQQEPSK